MNNIKEALINRLCGRIAALRGARNLDIFLYMPRFLRSVRLALHPAQTINQRFLNTPVDCYCRGTARNPGLARIFKTGRFGMETTILWNFPSMFELSE